MKSNASEAVSKLLSRKLALPKCKSLGIIDGSQALMFSLTSGKLSADIMTYGAVLHSLVVPDQTGKPGNVTLGHENPKDYAGKNAPYLGVVVGRYANRIANARFSLDGKTQTLEANDGNNCLHSGPKGYHHRHWTPLDQAPSTKALPQDAQSLTLTLDDPDGSCGFPGHVSVALTYTLTPSMLLLEYIAASTQPTPINLTHHAYFNLRDGGNTPIADHVVQLNSGRYTPTSKELVPTGQILPVTGTPYDFTKPTRLGDRLHQTGTTPPGFDTNYVLTHLPPTDLSAVVRGESSEQAAAVVKDPHSGRVMEMFTSEPGVQFYTGNFLDGSTRGHAAVHRQHHGFCLETQRFADSPNQPGFPNSILRPGQIYRHTTAYRFGID